MKHLCSKIVIFIEEFILEKCILSKNKKNSYKKYSLDNSIFLEFMGNTPVMKMFDYLLTIRELDFSKTDAIVNSKIGRSAFYRLWDKFLDLMIVIPSRTIGKIQLYKLNVRDERVKKLIELYEVLLLKNFRMNKKKL